MKVAGATHTGFRAQKEKKLVITIQKFKGGPGEENAQNWVGVVINVILEV